jgi:hypothetical protein
MPLKFATVTYANHCSETIFGGQRRVKPTWSGSWGGGASGEPELN